MKSSTYGSIATIAFVKNKDKVCKSVDSAIKVTDRYCKELNLQNNFSYMTKYRILNDLIVSKILSDKKEKKKRKLKLSNEINKFLEI